MTPSKPKNEKPPEEQAPAEEQKDQAVADDFGADEVKQAVEEAQEKGYFGSKVDPLPNSAHSLESGPDSPTVEEQRAALADAQGSKDGDR